jgi:hypothetical protein
MDPRDRFDPDTEAGDREPPPDDIRTEGTTQAMPGAEPSDGTTESGQTSRAGMPGDGAGRRDEIGGKTGVYPFSEAPADVDAPVRTGAEFGQGDRGPEGYNDAGTSEGSPAGTAQELLEDDEAG